MRLADKTEEFVNPDFVPRSYTRPLKEIAFVACLAVIVIITLSLFPEMVGGDVVARILLILLVLSVAAYMIIRRQQHNDLIMATEFENLLFSAAASLGSNFCFFMRNDGTIVYANDGTRRMFPRFNYEQSRALDNLLNEGKVDSVDRDRLYSAMALGKKEILVFAISDTSGARRDFILIIEPLRRPAGYFVIRGREYYSERTAVIKLTGKLQKTSLDKIATLVQKIPSPAFITNESGTLEFANAALESLLSYHDNEMVETKMTLQRMVYHADGMETGEFGLGNFIGTVLLKKRDGNVVKAQLDQKLCYDEGGNLTGCCGILLD